MTLPGGSDSLLAMIGRNRCAVIEYGNKGFVRLKGLRVEGASYYSNVFDSVRHLLPASVKIFRPAEYGSPEYLAALELARKNWPADKVPVFVECGCCGHLHRKGRAGDCRNDAERFTESDIEDALGNAWLICSDGGTVHP